MQTFISVTFLPLLFPFSSHSSPQKFLFHNDTYDFYSHFIDQGSYLVKFEINKVGIFNLLTERVNTSCKLKANFNSLREWHKLFWTIIQQPEGNRGTGTMWISYATVSMDIITHSIKFPLKKNNTSESLEGTDQWAIDLSDN